MWELDLELLLNFFLDFFFFFEEEKWTIRYDPSILFSLFVFTEFVFFMIILIDYLLNQLFSCPKVIIGWMIVGSLQTQERKLSLKIQSHSEDFEFSE